MEANLNFVKALCGEAEISYDIEEKLKKFNFHIILNANPISREKVENGEYCLRTNENGVDINRNFPTNWE